MFLRAIREPARALFRVMSPLAPQAFWSRYTALARRQLPDGPRLLLSFDCETDRDTEVARDVHDACSDAGVSAAFAVPGELIAREPASYVFLVRRGVEIINHGYRQHTEEVTGRPDLKRTSLSYRDLSLEEILVDMRRGHEACREELGVEPIGFRTPHFGDFQRPADLALIHRESSRLGYLFSSSTVPLVGFRRGPLWSTTGGLVELPVSGSLSHPHLILDSWNYVGKDGTGDGALLLDELLALASYLRVVGTGIINVYMDPSDIWGWDEFFSTLTRMRDLSSTFADVMSLVGARHRG